MNQNKLESGKQLNFTPNVTIVVLSWILNCCGPNTIILSPVGFKLHIYSNYNFNWKWHRRSWKEGMKNIWISRLPKLKPSRIRTDRSNMIL